MRFLARRAVLQENNLQLVMRKGETYVGVAHRNNKGLTNTGASLQHQRKGYEARGQTAQVGITWRHLGDVEDIELESDLWVPVDL